MKKKMFSTTQRLMFRVYTLIVFAFMVSLSANGQCTYYLDWDGDGYGNPSSSYVDPACGLPVSGYVLNNIDCDDSEAHFTDNDNDGFGIAPSIPCGGPNPANWPDDCDDTQRLYADNDNDGYGTLPFVACNGVTNDDDCDDSQTTFTDNDGDGFGIDPSVPCSGANNNVDCDDDAWTFRDTDNDGYGSGFLHHCGVYNSDDCNDNDDGINPGVVEFLCDGVDNNCSGQIDEGNTLAVDAGLNKIVYRGYADSSSTRLQSTSTGGVAPLTRVWSTAGNSNLGSGTFITVGPTETRIYYLTVTDANDCTAIDSVKVCVIDVRCGNNNKSVIICHGTGSAINPYTTLCIGKTETNSHFRIHPGEQLGPCGMVKACDWDNKATRLSGSDMEVNGEVEYLTAFPNPFSNTATIRFMLPENDLVNIRVFDVAGREMQSLYEGTAKAGEIYEVTLNGNDFAGGMYFLVMNSQSGMNQTRKLILEK